MSEPVEADAGRWGLLQDQVTGQAWLVSQFMHSPFRTLAGDSISILSAFQRQVQESTA